MKPESERKIRSFTSRLKINSAQVIVDLEEVIGPEAIDDHIDKIVDAFEGVMNEFPETSIDPNHAWHWFAKTYIRPLDATLLETIINDGPEALAGYFERLRYGDYA